MLFWIGNSGKELFDKGDTHGFIRGYRAGFSDGWDERARQDNAESPGTANNISRSAMQKIYDVVNDCGYDAESKCNIIRSFFAQRPC
jgi:hypothetical protein